MKRKAVNERKVLDQFISAYPEFPKGRIFKTESPDFILSVNPRYQIGIELTYLHDPSGNNHSVFTSTTVTKEILDAVIHKKEEKIPLYEKKQPNEIWLIITITDTEQLPGFNLFNKLESWTFENGFRRVFLFNLVHKKIYQLV